jgi:hypothetical protein
MDYLEYKVNGSEDEFRIYKCDMGDDDGDCFGDCAGDGCGDD